MRVASHGQRIGRWVRSFLSWRVGRRGRWWIVVVDGLPVFDVSGCADHHR
ncbi:hypothetical protein I547_5066 [Mycobacterium kansasii 824]|uniref:Uncharacterized protein n=1 Tax=Mycobacterium kansasii TaxID=1768 RepID=A0A1V3WDJ1_MYCKA|nr:hypothetical protein I547_5066 [Mycobacterium kansasii 824]OOK65015.1 hypothetical protein BZL30_8876 [Mycobacterium kansasii]